MTTTVKPTISKLDKPHIEETRSTPLQQTIKNLRGNTSAMIGLTIIVLLVLMGIFAPLIATHDPKQVLTGVPGYEGIQKGGPPCIPAWNDFGCASVANAVTSLNSGKVFITTAGGTPNPEDLTFNDGQAAFIVTNLSATANMIHIIDGVLIPPEGETYSFNITAQSFAPPLMLSALTSGENGDFTLLSAVLLEDERYEELARKVASAIPFTLLAPTDEAFAAYFEQEGITQEEFLADPELVEQMISYHVITGRKEADTLAELGAIQQNMHLMGVDLNFRDEFSRVVYGVRRSLPVGLAAVSVAIVTGTLIGLVSGYMGGWADNFMMRLMDVLIAFPSLLLAIAIVTILGPGLLNALIAIAIVSIPQYARIVRASVISVKEQEFITANRALGAGPVRILFLQVLPNSMTPVVVQGTLGIGTAILDAAALSFLGLGAQPPTPEWGLMLSEARQDFRTFPHLMFFPGIAIMITVLAFNLLGDGIRDVLDPRLNKR
jgi:ABC-type dipeptide/oligopeptide/nickel transport system permease subunit